MPILDPGRQPEVARAVDLTREQPTVEEQPLNQVKLDLHTPVGGVNFQAIGSRMVPAINFIAVGSVAVGAALAIVFICQKVGSPAWMSPPAALIAMTVAFGFGRSLVRHAHGDHSRL